MSTSPGLGSEKAFDVSTGVTASPSWLFWLEGGVPTTGAWLDAVRWKLLVAVPPCPSFTVTATV